MSGVHMDSQAAYELASQGLMRPANNKLPVVFGLKCVHFDPPNFTLGKKEFTKLLKCFMYCMIYINDITENVFYTLLKFRNPIAWVYPYHTNV